MGGGYLSIVVCVVNVLEVLMSLGSAVLSRLTIWISTLLSWAGRGEDSVSGPTKPCVRRGISPQVLRTRTTREAGLRLDSGSRPPTSACVLRLMPYYLSHELFFSKGC